jgi:hypothetical protein
MDVLLDKKIPRKLVSSRHSMTPHFFGVAVEKMCIKFPERKLLTSPNIVSVSGLEN